MKKYLRRVARRCAAASLVGAVIGFASLANADPAVPLAPRRVEFAPSPTALPAPYPGVMTMPPWLVLTAPIAGPSLTVPWAIPHPLCLGAGCEVTTAVVFDNDPRFRASNPGQRFIGAFGAFGALPAAAFALFAMPKPRRPDALAMSVGPMFALGGLGIALRCAW